MVSDVQLFFPYEVQSNLQAQVTTGEMQLSGLTLLTYVGG